MLLNLYAVYSCLCHNQLRKSPHVNESVVSMYTQARRCFLVKCAEWKAWLTLYYQRKITIFVGSNIHFLHISRYMEAKLHVNLSHVSLTISKNFRISLSVSIPRMNCSDRVSAFYVQNCTYSYR